MRRHIGRDMQARPVLPFDNLSFPAYVLNGVKYPHPDHGGHNGEHACSCKFFLHKHFVSHDHGKKNCDYHRESDKLPSLFMQKDTVKLPRINPHLSPASDSFVHSISHYFSSSSLYFFINSSASPSPPSSSRLILFTIPSSESVPKNSFASSIMP